MHSSERVSSFVCSLLFCFYLTLKDCLYCVLVTDRSSLYNDYAGPFNLCDICLLILCTCKEESPSVIDTLWRSIICEEVLPCQTESENLR